MEIATKPSIAIGLSLLFATSVTIAQNQNPPTAANSGQDCHGITVELSALKKSGRGEVTAEFMLQNNNNSDRAMVTYYGGANGRNTFLIDNSGNEWPRKRMDGNGNRRQALIAGVKTKYSLVFHIDSGGDEANIFQVIIAPQILPLSGMGEYGFCQLKYANAALKN